MKKRIIYLLVCCIAFSSCSSLKNADDVMVPITEQKSSTCTSCQPLLLPAQTKIVEIGENIVQIDLPVGYFFKAFVQNNNAVLLNSSITIQCKNEGRSVYRQHPNGMIEYACTQYGSGGYPMEISEQAEYTPDYQSAVHTNNSIQLMIDNHNQLGGYTKNRPLITNRVEVGIGSAFDELKRIHHESFMHQLNEMVRKEPDTESLKPVVIAASSFEQLIKLPPATEADINAPEVIHELRQIMHGLKMAAEAQHLPIRSGKALVPVVIKNRVAYWQIPEIYLEADNSFGFAKVTKAINQSLIIR